MAERKIDEANNDPSVCRIPARKIEMKSFDGGVFFSGWITTEALGAEIHFPPILLHLGDSTPCDIINPPLLSSHFRFPQAFCYVLLFLRS